MDKADVRLGFLFAYFVAAALHAGLAFLVYLRYHGRSNVLEIRIFTWANVALAAWHLLQLTEYGVRLAAGPVDPSLYRGLAAAQLVLGMTVLMLFFHLFATFERVYRRTAPSLRAALTTHVHRYRQFYLPAGYLVLVLMASVYLLDRGFVGGPLAALRGIIGPTSAYLFGFTILGMTFVMFPARRGQEKVGVAVLGRGFLMGWLAITLLMIALWHTSHPRRVEEVLLPMLHLSSVAFVVFLGLVRYEFPFMDRYIRDGVRLVIWSSVCLAAFFAFNRLQFAGEGWGRYATSLSRLGVLMLAVAMAPALDRASRKWIDRALLDRDVDLARAVHRFAQQLSRARSEHQLVEGATRDIREAVHPKRMRLVRGSSPQVLRMVEARFDGAHYYRLVVPLGASGPPIGWLFLGHRRNFYPYFDAERQYLGLVCELLGGALEALRPSDRVESAKARDPKALQRENDRLSQQLRLSRRELTQARGAVRELREKLDPELVADVLAAADEVATRDPKSSLEIVNTLRAAYDYLLPNDHGSVPLEEEMAFARSYLALERLRTRNRLEVSLRYDESLKDQELPRRLLQPLIDNALVHGLSRELRSGRIYIQARRLDGRCQITVADNGRGFAGNFHQEAVSGEGGLARALQWLQDRYGNDVIMSVDSPGEDGTSLLIDLPVRDLKRKRRSVA